MKKNQKIAILGIVLITLLLGILILTVGSSGGNTEPKETTDTHEEKSLSPEKDHDQEGEMGSGVDKADEKGEENIALTEAQIKDAGIAIETSGPAKITTSIELPAEIKFNQDRTARIVPRTVGIVESVLVNLGQSVKKGQILAVIGSAAVSDQRSELLTARERLAFAQSAYNREKMLWEEKISAAQDYQQAQHALREAQIAVRNAEQKLAAMGVANSSGSTNRYELRAPFDGMIVEKNISLGEFVREDANAFTISDLSTVWAEMIVPASQLNVVRVGETAVVRATSIDSEATGKVSYVGSLLGEQTRTAAARIVLPNPAGAWRPGLFANVHLVSRQDDVPVSVSAEAIQTVEGKPTVFVRVPEGFQLQPITIGKADAQRVEVLNGLKAGAPYAADGSFVLKAEQGKSSSDDDH